MDILCSREEDDISDIKQAEVRICLNGCVNGTNWVDTNTSNAKELHEQGHQNKPLRKYLAKSASFPSAVPVEDDGMATALQIMFSEDSVPIYSRPLSLPTPLKLVSALKGSREKEGLSPKKLTVKWAPDVYDPPPTSSLHTVRNRRQQKSKKKKNDKKKNGKKGQKGNNAGRGSDGVKDNKHHLQLKPPPEVHQKRLTNCSGNFDGLTVCSPDSYCGSSFLKKSPTKMHYPVAEAL